MTRLYVILGRFGDVLNTLPLLYADAQAGAPSGIMVAKEFASILDGISYAEPVIFDGNFMEIERAVDEASKLCADVRIAQLAGPKNEILRVAWDKAGLNEQQPQTDSFQKDCWRLAGRFDEWRKGHPLIFDRRDATRESALLIKALPKEAKKARPIILVSADGKSSPFPHKPLLLKLLSYAFPRHRLVDLSAIQADHLYDLLALLEHPDVKCLVASDSALLHLAYACPKLPVVALIQDQPTLFHGSAWRPNHVCHVRYGDFTQRFDEVLDAIENIGKPGCRFNPSLPKPKLIHLWSQYDITEENHARHVAAKVTWKQEYVKGSWVACPLEIGMVGRDSKTVFKDAARYPYFKDAVRLACLRANDEDVIVFTRADSAFYDNISITLEQVEFPLFSFRQSKNADWAHPAVDLFAFNKKWWRENQNDVPDFIIGPDYHWNRAVMELMKLKGGRHLLKFSVYRDQGATVPVIRHGYREHNEKLAKEFLQRHDLLHPTPKVSQQARVSVINPKALFRAGYNPSLIRFQGELLMAYRAHNGSTPKADLAMAELDEQFNIRRNQPLDVLDHYSHEDARLFTIGNQLWMSYIESMIGTAPAASCVVKLSRLVKRNDKWEVAATLHPKHPSNTHERLNKNWCFFEDAGKPFCIFTSQPEQVVLEFAGDKIMAEHRSPAPKWAHGQIRGGAILPHGDKLLRFFHSRLENEPDAIYWRYYVGCLVMDAKPPFAVERICHEPLLRGSEMDDLSPTDKSLAPFWKPNVVLPFGVVKEGSEFLVSIGVNDSACAVARFTEAELKL